ncbi:MAG: hypothetical protein ACLFVJ_13970 [Persicimonas sp.]
MIRQATILMCTLAVALLVAVSAPAADEQADAREQFSGTWELSLSEAQAREQIDQAIEDVVEQMFFIKRPFARSELRGVTEPCATLQIDFPGEQVAVQCDDKPPSVSPNGDERVRYEAADGTIYRVEQKQSGRVLRQIFYSDDGRRTNTMHLSRDGRTFDMRVSIDSDQLPEAVEYELTFRAQSD